MAYKLTTPQQRLLRSLDAEKAYVIRCTEHRTARVLVNLGLATYEPVGSCLMGYRLTYRGLSTVVDLMFHD